MGKKFDAKSQKWIDVPENTAPAKSSSSSSNRSSSSSSSSSGSRSGSGSRISRKSSGYTSTTATPTSIDDGMGTSANKEYVNIELTYLTGDVSVETNSVTLLANAGDTVELKGSLGSSLSGLYFITEVTFELSTSGVSLKYSVLKNGFGKTLKPYNALASTQQQDNVPVDTTKSVSINVNDKVRFIEGVDAVYSNASDGVRVPDWVKEKTYTVSKTSEDGSQVLLQEIESWTYTKFVQKA